MMTRNEVEARAKAIWGDKVFNIQKANLDCWFVDETIPNPSYRGRDARVEGAAIPQNMIRVHVLDGNGHAACHPVCAKWEESI